MTIRKLAEICLSAILFVSCVGAPPSGSKNSRGKHKQEHIFAPSLQTKVERLATDMERTISKSRASHEDIEEWINCFEEYFAEYIQSTQNLSDESCENIEYNFGKIAGLLYKNTRGKILDIAEIIENYEKRSEKWEGALENGWESAIEDNYDE